MPSTRSSKDNSEKESIQEKDVGVVKKTKFENSWVFLAKDDVFESNSSSSIISLTHPGYGTAAKFLLKKTENKIYEIQTYKEPYRSWLIGETVKADGSIYITTPVDPIFIILPHLKSQCATRAIPLEQLLVSSSEKDDLKELTELSLDLKAVADLKGPADLCAYKYNEEKTLKWLEAKVRRLSRVIKAEKFHVKSGAVSATFVVSSLKEDGDDEEYYLKYACGIVNEYLPEDLGNLLLEKFKFKAEVIATLGNKRKSEQGNKSNSPNKKIKRELTDNKSDLENGEKTSDVADSTSEYFSSSNQQKTLKPVTLTAKEKQLQKAASGSKNIMSFFSKK